MATASQKVKNVAEDFEEGFAEFANDAKDIARKAGDKTGAAATTATEKLKDAASFVGDKAKQATGAVGAGMESLGGAIREHTPDKGVLGNAGAAVADKLEGAGHYLEEQGLKGMGDDITNLIRKNPIPALLIGVGVGFLLARMVRR